MQEFSKNGIMASYKNVIITLSSFDKVQRYHQLNTIEHLTKSNTVPTIVQV